jgi:hypothetical protein
MSHGFPYSPLAWQIANRLADGVRSTGGATIDVNGTPGPATGYQVGVPGYGTTLPLSTFTLDDVAEWVTNTRRHIAAADATYLGAWVDNDTVYLDVSQRFNDKGVALIVASQRDELAIWDNAAGAEIRVTK